MKKPQNPSAFPSKTIDHHESAMQSRTVYNGQEEGMTLRDYFAAKAMQSIIVSSNYDNYTGNNGMPVPNFISEQSYLISDAMLKQREL